MTKREDALKIIQSVQTIIVRIRSDYSSVLLIFFALKTTLSFVRLSS